MLNQLMSFFKPDEQPILANPQIAELEAESLLWKERSKRYTAALQRQSERITELLRQWVDDTPDAIMAWANELAVAEQAHHKIAVKVFQDIPAGMKACQEQLYKVRVSEGEGDYTRMRRELSTLQDQLNDIYDRYDWNPGERDRVSEPFKTRITALTMELALQDAARGIDPESRIARRMAVDEANRQV